MRPAAPIFWYHFYTTFYTHKWYAILAPRGTPQPIVARLNQEFRDALADPGIRDLLSKSGVDPEGSSPDELARYIRSEIVKWAKVIKAANVKLD